MNKQVVAFRRLRTSQSREDVLLALEGSLRRIGGVLYRSGDTISIQNGTAGVSNAFASELRATATVRTREPGDFEITCDVTASPSTAFWLCAVFGLFCLPPLWVVCIFHFLVDPLPAYQRALDQIELKP